MTLVKRFIFDQAANTEIEYAILVTMLAGAIVPIVYGVGSALAGKLAAAQGILFTVTPFGG